MAGSIREFAQMLMWLLRHLLFFRWQLFLPSLHTYREKGNVLINF